MGLFGSKKEMMRATPIDVFSQETLDTIKDVVDPKLENREYGKYRGMAEMLLVAVRKADEEFNEKEWRSILYAAGAMTKIEPSLAPMLQAGIDRFHALKKGK